MKLLMQVVLAGSILAASVLYANSITYDYKIVDESKDDEPNPTGKFVNEFSVIELVEKEVLRKQQQKDIAELELHRENEKQKVVERDKVKQASRGERRSVPNSNTSMKSYMDYRKITSKTSPQYKFQRSGDVYTDGNGYRRVGDKFIIAVGTYYADKIGTELIIELDSGEEFEAILGDVKANIHTDGKNQQHKVDGSIVEFLVDSKILEPIVKKMGNCSFSEFNNFKGNIKSITVINNID